MGRPAKSAVPKEAQAYEHPTADLASRPEIGTQAHFRKALPPTSYRYDSSLAPELVWDGQNPAREVAEALIAELADSARCLAELAAQPAAPERDAEIARLRSAIGEAETRLRRLSGPFLNWAGKAERLSFEVPTLPLFVHERLSTRAILETLRSHRRDKQEDFLGALFGSPERSLSDQVLRAYEHRDQWVNRMILGDSLVAMTSLLRFESLGGQVQMIYMDPPYGVKFGSNFQPFVRKRDVSHNDDEDLTREPEMVQAYRDTWELGLHSYLTYLRDRLLLCRDLLAPSGSIFVQISDENLHHVRELMDEVFGAENLVSVITVKKTSSASSDLLPTVSDFLLWYARDKQRLRYRQLYMHKEAGGAGGGQYNYVEEVDGTRRPVGRDETFEEALAKGRLFCHDNLTSQRPPGDFPVEFEGRTFRPGKGYWKTGPEGMEKLKAARRLMVVGNTLRYVRFLTDFPVFPITNLWDDTVTSGFDDPKVYVVQTNKTIVERCLLMTTLPGDLVLDPTCGSGTTAYVAEQWGRRWITMDTSRVPLALARQRLLTAAFDYYELKDEARGPAGGFNYLPEEKSRNPKSVGPGIVPHIMLKSIANNEPPDEAVLVDRPEVVKSIVRVTGPFAVEASIPAASQPEEFQVGSCQFPEGGGVAARQGEPPDGARNWQLETRNYIERMLEVLRRAPVLRLAGNQTLTLKHIRPPAKTLALSAEAEVELRVSSSEFPVPSWEFREEQGEHERGLPGPRGVAEGDGLGGACVQEHTGIPAGGAVRADQSDAASGGVRAEQHRGGTGTADARGVQAVLGTGTRIVAGAGHAGGTGAAAGFPVGAGQRDPRGPGSRGPADAQCSDREAGRLTSAPSSTQLETGNSQLETVPVAILFGPENGPISERLVREAWDEAGLKHYARLFVIGFGIDPKAREFVEKAGQIGIPCAYLQATMDLQMGDLLKNMRSSQVFSVCGLPDVRVSRVETRGSGVRGQGSGSGEEGSGVGGQGSGGTAASRSTPVPGTRLPTPSPRPLTPGLSSADPRPLTPDPCYQAQLLGLDTFDPATMEPAHLKPDEVPAWFLDTDYNGLVFRVCQAFFPRTGAWESLKRALKAEFEDSVWEHLAGTTSAPFAGGSHGQIAVKVIDPRGNELIVVKKLQ